MSLQNSCHTSVLFIFFLLQLLWMVLLLVLVEDVDNGSLLFADMLILLTGMGGGLVLPRVCCVS